MTNMWDSIPTPDPLPSMGGEGYGVSADTGEKTKAAEIIDKPIAIVGYMTMPNQYKEKDTDPDLTTLFEIVTPEGDTQHFWHSSNTLRKQVEARNERDEIPFRTVLELRDSKKGNTSYYTFA